MIQVRKIRVLGCVAAGLMATHLMATQVRALECPAPPLQASKDWDTTVNTEVGKIGWVTGVQLQTRVLNVTRDLMGKLPGADRLYLEQMMFASYCSALRDDKSLPESAKARQILEYRRELQKSLAAAPVNRPAGNSTD